MYEYVCVYQLLILVDWNVSILWMVCMYLSIDVCICVCVHICVYYVYVCMYVCVCMCVCVCVCVCVFVWAVLQFARTVTVSTSRLTISDYQSSQSHSNSWPIYQRSKRNCNNSNSRRPRVQDCTHSLAHSLTRLNEWTLVLTDCDCRLWFKYPSQHSQVSTPQSRLEISFSVNSE